MSAETPPTWKRHLQTIVDHRAFQTTIITLILINAVIVGLETYPDLYGEYKPWFFFSDQLLLWIFTLEIAMRFFAAKSVRSFFQNGWNWFDFLIVGSSHLLAGAHFVTVLRILRVLRVLRAISVIPSLRRLVDALLMTIPAMGNIMLLMFIIFYIFAVMGTMLYQQIAPEYFGSLGLSMLTLFQVVTLESWAEEVMRPLLHVPWSWLYFVSFILVGTFIVFNLFIGVIVNNVEKTQEDEDEEDETKKEVQALRHEIQSLKTLIEQQNNNHKE
ncbi:ion transporter [Texcoconibacillus texcoconensis]|uniref:Voltage-gated sodium channel n=1 Tax=Texcoconibacillus texcoconensis TaxID=1095777 RepID=A0A840QNS8_9BACI|nr:ion transporter [Texcoconibacillus texcoconensis]MBB5173008.1 voltage-gated sodium channel [Texcoconibacillus texcoconensis]